MTRIASEALIERLADWGIDTVFGLPANGIDGIVEGLRRHPDMVRFVPVDHEAAAAFMATGYARATGKIGVCLAPSGPAGIHLLGGLYDAKLGHAPVLAITGVPRTPSPGTGYQLGYQQEAELYAEVAEYDQVIRDPAEIPEVTDMAVRTAYARHGVARIIMPGDVQLAEPDDLQVSGVPAWQDAAANSTADSAAGSKPDEAVKRSAVAVPRRAIPTTLLKGEVQPPCR
jgi:pyruvate dehydrogenase (quinone)